MAYDSAIDINWTVQNIDLDNRNVTLSFDTPDSSDGRPTIYRKFNLANDEFNDSDIRVYAEAAKGGVAGSWQSILQRREDNPGFSADSIIGTGGTVRYKPFISGDVPIGNPLYHEIITTRTEDSYSIVDSYSLSVMSGTDRRLARDRIERHGIDLWAGLQADGRLDSVVSAIGADSLQTADRNEVVYRFSGSVLIGLRDSLMAEVRGVLGYGSDSAGDSDFAAYVDGLADAGGNIQLENF